MGKQLIQTITVGSGGAAAIEFTSIPQDATDLIVVWSIRTNLGSTFDFLSVQFNADTTLANYTYRELQGSGSGSPNSTNGSTLFIHGGYANSAGQTSNTFANTSIYIPNYSSSLAKSVSVDSVTENNATVGYQTIAASRWSGTAAITSIKLLSANTSSFVQHSTASLYKFTKGSGGATVS